MMTKTGVWRAAAAAAAFVGGCSDVEPLTVELEGISYTIPREHVVRNILPGQGQVYVVARPSGSSFQVVYTATHKYSRNYQGGGAPLVPEINDVSARGFETFDFPSGITVCRVGPPHWNCGLSLVDRGVLWSVIFDRDQVPNSEALRRQASGLLAEYRGE